MIIIQCWAGNDLGPTKAQAQIFGEAVSEIYNGPTAED